MLFSAGSSCPKCFMDKRFLLLLALCFGTAQADVLTLPEAQGKAYSGPLPERGQTMAGVQRQFGAPNQRHGTVGGNKPQHPPITRWDYAGFYVIFEKDRVIDAVVPEAPPPLHNKDELEPAG